MFGSLILLIFSVFAVEADAYAVDALQTVVEENFKHAAFAAKTSAGILEALLEEYMESATFDITKDVWVSPHMLKQMVVKHVESDPYIFGSAIAFLPGFYVGGSAGDFGKGVKDFNMTKVVGPGSIYCPYAYEVRVAGDSSMSVESFDLASRGYNYSVPGGTGDEWFVVVRKRTEEMIRNGIYERWGLWTKPYFDTGGGEITMVTYSMPVVIKLNNTLKFIAVVTADIPVNEIICKEGAEGGECATFSCGPSSLVTLTDALGGVLYCEECGVGYYKSVGDGYQIAGYTLLGEGKCAFCPDGGSCRGDGAVKAIEGYWLESESATHPLRCNHESRCCVNTNVESEKRKGGGKSQNSSESNNTGGDTRVKSCIYADEFACSKGRRGFMCEECSENLGPWAGSCIPCSSNETGGLSSIVYFAGPAFLALGFYLYPTTVLRISGVPKSEIFDITVDVVQLLLITMDPTDHYVGRSDWKALKTIISILGGGDTSRDGDKAFFSCPFSTSPLHAIFVWNYFAFMTLGWYPALYIIIYFTKTGRKKEHRRNEWLSGAWKMYQTLYGIVIASGFLMLNCEAKGDLPHLRNHAHPEVLCDEDEYRAMKGVFISVTFIYGLVVPMFLFTILRGMSKKQSVLFDRIQNRLFMFECDVEKRKRDMETEKLLVRKNRAIGDALFNIRNRVQFRKRDILVKQNSPVTNSRRKLQNMLGSFRETDVSRMKASSLEQTMSGKMSEKSRQSIERYGILFMRYKVKRRQYGHAIFLLRRFVFVGIHFGLTTDKDSYLSSTFLFALSVGYLILQSTQSPYQRYSDNCLATFGMFVLTVVTGFRLKILGLSYELAKTISDDRNDIEETSDRLVFYNNSVSVAIFVWIVFTSIVGFHHLMDKFNLEYRIFAAKYRKKFKVRQKKTASTVIEDILEYVQTNQPNANEAYLEKVEDSLCKIITCTPKELSGRFFPTVAVSSSGRETPEESSGTTAKCGSKVIPCDVPSADERHSPTYGDVTTVSDADDEYDECDFLEDIDIPSNNNVKTMGAATSTGSSDGGEEVEANNHSISVQWL